MIHSKKLLNTIAVILGMVPAVAYTATTTSNMLLSIPSRNDTTYPTSISNSFTKIDQHDHTTNKGVQIPTAGLEDNAVSSAKLKSDNSVDANRAVTTTHIRDAAVTGVKLASGVVDGTTIEFSSNTMRVKDGSITTAKLATGSVTQAKREALNLMVSSSSAAFLTGSATYVDVTNLSVTGTTTGRPVYITLLPDGTNPTEGFIQGLGALGTIGFVLDGVEIARHGVVGASPCSSVSYIMTPSAASHTFKTQAHNDGTHTTEVFYCKLAVYEL